MTRQTSGENGEATDWIQFRGAQTSVTNDATGVRFGMTQVGDRTVHAALPVVDPDDPDPPADAVAAPVAERLVESNPLIAYGVACPEPGCDAVLDTPEGRNSHLSSHTGVDDEGADTDV